MRNTMLVLLLFVVGCGKVPVPTQPDIAHDAPPGALTAEQTETVTYQIEPFNINLMGLDSVPFAMPLHKFAFQTAARKWEDVIVEGLPDVGNTDDVDIMVYWESERHSEGNIAVGGNVFRRGTDNKGLPYWGFITIYSNIYDHNYTSAEWIRIAMHEIGHALGFTPDRITQIGTTQIGGIRYFLGERANRGYRAILYYIQQEKLAFALPYLYPPLDRESPHWDKVLRWELMSPTFDGQSLLTPVTIGAMADMGYTVNMLEGEMPPVSALTKPAIGRPIFRCDGNGLQRVVP